MTHSQYKCQVQGKESFIDNLFVVFSQSYLISQVHQFCQLYGLIETYKYT